MASFYARVELHDADNDDYEVLHSEMRQRYFRRSVMSNDGGVFRLPSGTYHSKHYSSRAVAFDAVKESTAMTFKKSWIVIIEAEGSTFRLDMTNDDI